MFRIFLVLIAILGVTCGPVAFVPGTSFGRGDVAGRLPDWAFTDPYATVGLETRGRLLDHAVNVLAVAVGEHLYVSAILHYEGLSNVGGDAYQKRWVRNVLRDPRVRVAVGGEVYPGRAFRVTSQREADAFARAYARKYLGVEPEEARLLLDPPGDGASRVEVWLFRIESGPEEA